MCWTCVVWGSSLEGGGTVWTLQKLCFLLVLGHPVGSDLCLVSVMHATYQPALLNQLRSLQTSFDHFYERCCLYIAGAAFTIFCKKKFWCIILCTVEIINQKLLCFIFLAHSVGLYFIYKINNNFWDECTFLCYLTSCQGIWKERVFRYCNFLILYI